MSEKLPTNENLSERVPNEREVLNIFESIIGKDFEVLRSLEDERGLYMLEVQTKDDIGDIVQYNYIRAGKYAEGSSTETVIDVVYYSGDVPVGGHAIAKFKDGEWIQEPV